MTGHQNRLSRLWNELKRRNVTRVISVYAATAFVILELTDIVAPSLNLPSWTLKFVIIILSFGFIIAVVVSWIYDFHPLGGMVKTEPAEKRSSSEMPGFSNSWKIAGYISFVVILGLIALNIFGGKRSPRIDESLAKSIAVLPFHNLSGDAGQEYICDGLTDEIIGYLFKVRSFEKIVPFSSVMNYKDQQRNIPRIAEDLGVNYILGGSFKRMGDELKITAQLIEAKNDNFIWAHDYEKPYSEIMGIPGEVAIQIAEHLKAFLNESERENIKKIPTANQEAYELLQTGLYLTRTRRFEPNSEVFELALEAIKLDPDYAEAYALAGRMALWNGIYTGNTDVQSAAMEAMPYLNKALELDQNNASAHHGMGFIDELAEWDYITAEKEYQRIMDLEPNNSELYPAPVEFELKMNQLEDLTEYMDKAQGYDNVFFAIVGGHILLDNKKEAYELLAQASHNAMALPFVGEKYIWLEEYDSAAFYLESALRSEHYEMDVPRWQAALALVYHKTNDTIRARATIDRLISKSDTTSAGSPAYFTGWYYSSIGKVDSAFYWLERAVENRSPELPWLKVNPAFNGLKGDPRYRDLYERTGHKAFDDYMANKKE